MLFLKCSAVVQRPVFFYSEFFDIHPSTLSLSIFEHFDIQSFDVLFVDLQSFHIELSNIPSLDIQVVWFSAVWCSVFNVQLENRNCSRLSRIDSSVNGSWPNWPWASLTSWGDMIKNKPKGRSWLYLASWRDHDHGLTSWRGHDYGLTSWEKHSHEITISDGGHAHEFITFSGEVILMKSLPFREIMLFISPPGEVLLFN